MRIFALVFLGMMLPRLCAQNAMFLPFGQSSGQVKDYLASLDYVRELLSPSPDTLIHPVSARQQVVYCFRDGILYSIEDQRSYKDLKEADRVSKTCIEYMGREDRKVRNLGSSQGLGHFASVEEDRIVELFFYPGSKKEEARISLRVTSRNHGPRMETENLAAAIFKRSGE
jgi:hypothetical protein